MHRDEVRGSSVSQAYCDKGGGVKPCGQEGVSCWHVKTVFFFIWREAPWPNVGEGVSGS